MTRDEFYDVVRNNTRSTIAENNIMAAFDKCYNSRMNITKQHIYCACGESSDWEKILTKEQADIMNEVGYTGKYKDERMSLYTALTKYCDNENVKYELTKIIASDNMEFTDSYILTKIEIV